MTSGTVKKVQSDRGFGFITAEDGQDYLAMTSIRALIHRGCLMLCITPTRPRCGGVWRERQRYRIPTPERGAVGGRGARDRGARQKLSRPRSSPRPPARAWNGTGTGGICTTSPGTDS
jgi:hypothetical protein